MTDQKNPQNTSTTDPNQQNLQKKEGQGVFGGNIDAFDAIAQQGVHQPDEHKNSQKEGAVHGHENEPIDPFLQSGAQKKLPEEENVDVPDPFLVDESEDSQSGENDDFEKLDDANEEENSTKKKKSTDLVEEQKNTEKDNNTAAEKNSDDDNQAIGDEGENIERNQHNRPNSQERKEDTASEEIENKKKLEENKTKETIQESYDIVSEKKSDEAIEEENEDTKERKQDEVDKEGEKDTDTTKHENSLERQASASKNEDIEDDSDEESEDMQEENKEPTVTEENEEEPTKDQSPLQGKFQELFVLIQHAVDIHAELHDDSFSLVGADNDISFVEYTFEQAENSITIYKNALDKKTNENEEHILVFTLDGDEEVSLHVVVDNTLLFDEKDIADDKSAQIQIMDKLSKFLFLVGQEKKSLDKAYEEYKEKKSKKEKVQAFRNF